MKIAQYEIQLQTEKEFDIVDLTNEIQQKVGEACVKNGFVTVASMHTTTAMIINEAENGFFQDLRIALKRLAPKSIAYKHNNFTHRIVPRDEPKNGHSHILASLIGASQSIPISRARLKLGKWQRVFFLELDSARERRISITVIGE